MRKRTVLCPDWIVDTSFSKLVPHHPDLRFKRPTEEPAPDRVAAGSRSTLKRDGFVSRLERLWIPHVSKWFPPLLPFFFRGLHVVGRLHFLLSTFCLVLSLSAQQPPRGCFKHRFDATLSACAKCSVIIICTRLFDCIATRNSGVHYCFQQPVLASRALDDPRHWHTRRPLTSSLLGYAKTAAFNQPVVSFVIYSRETHTSS